MQTTFQGLFHTLIGASHLNSGTVCQDSSDFQATEHYAIAVVADGHGSKKHFRSDVGSRLAVEAAVAAVSQYYTDPELFEETICEDPERVIRNIEKNIIARWDQAVHTHFREHPFTPEEQRPFTETEFAKLKLEAVYGTTLIIGVIGSCFTFGMQIGDGSLVIIEEDAMADMPIEDDETAPANVTASLCNSYAIDMFRSFFLPDKALAVFVSTDGLYTSFRSTDDFLDYHSIIASRLEKPEAFDRIVKRNLEKRTHFGTQDDISLSCAWDVEIMRNSLDALRQQVERNKMLAPLREAEHKARLQRQHEQRMRLIGEETQQ
ncbi:MAG: protein phosphatase 2C domain-containing protein [Oscillospiraceae bacterium]|nr:protein phosphatase 2C domain-containing protein [Oscillospiraceae bacterium]